MPLSLATPNVAESSSDDHFTFWPSCAVLVATFCALLLCSLPGLFSVLLILVVVLCGPAILAALCVVALNSYLRRGWRMAASILFAAALPIVLWRPIGWAADCVHLGLTVGAGIGVLNTPFISEDGKFGAYDWSVGLATNPSTFLIYDATDRIAAHGAIPRGDLNCLAKPRRLIGHYYVCSL